MTNNTHFVEARTKQLDTSKGIILEVFRSTVNNIPSGFSKSSVVVTECSYSCTRKRIGNNGKRLMLKDFFIPILQATTRNHQQYRSLARSVFWYNKSTFQYGIAIVKTYLLCLVWIGHCWCLRTIALQQAGFYGQWERLPMLLECSHNRFAHINALITGIDRRNGNLDTSYCTF